MQKKQTMNCLNREWKESRSDPVRERLVAQGDAPNLDTIRNLFPPTSGDAAFDQNVIKGNIERLETVPEVNTGHPFLDLSVKTGLACIDATFQGDHPKYGIKQYGQTCGDGFPPTIISAVDALSSWGLNRRAAQLFRYYLVTFVREDGTINYRGTSLAELGQLLHTGTLLLERTGTAGWWTDGFSSVRPNRGASPGASQASRESDGLLVGVPEDDEREKVGKFFHNNAWVSRGLLRWASACKMADACLRHRRPSPKWWPAR